jgi:hypothetical protein
MERENSPSQIEALAGVGLLRTLESGVLDSIECPRCHMHSVSVRFTRPSVDEYRTWFVCAECPFRLRVQNSERPRRYSADRLDEDLETFDSGILRQKRLS